MKLTVMATVFQQVQHSLLGVEGLSYLLYDDADLVSAVFERWGQIVLDLYGAIIDMEEVGALWHGDDLGFTTSTMISPKALREHLMPWFQRFGELAHAHGKTYWLHCCGNVYVTRIIDDLIDPVRLDAFHSFQDPILPIADFLRLYGDRMTAMGGVDMDKLCRYDEASLRSYMREILDRCMPRGRFVFGSGNTITSYVPVDNYLWMVDESRRWSAG
jgi:uroporphyrinogen decarboxylase